MSDQTVAGSNSPVAGFVAWVYHLMNVLSLGTILGAAYHLLPDIATLLSVVWYVLMVYESKWCQEFLTRRRARRIVRIVAEKARRAVILRAELALVQAELEKHNALLPGDTPRD